jgi:uncharacterized protein YdeI (YjbR/CyaY-like superfamily)
MNKKNPAVAFFFKQDKWRQEFQALRKIALACPLTEELKWGAPCYTFEGKNIVLIHGFKEYCAFLFFKGALMQDPDGILVQQTENVQATRQVRFTSVQQIVALETVLQDYIREAIRVEQAGLKVKYKKTAEFEMPEEFLARLEQVPGLQDAFDALTPGRQRGYLLYFSAPKQAATRVSRIEKCIPRIRDGKGLND